MIVDCYTVFRNEERMLPYFLSHYGEFCRKIHLYDDRSDDFSRTLIDACPMTEVHPTGFSGIDDMLFLGIYGNAFKELSKDADWVILVDVDEIIYHPELVTVLQTELDRGTQVIVPEGFVMISDHFPLPEDYSQIYHQIQTGLPDHWYSKPVIMRPSVSPQFQPGRHGMNNLKDYGSNGNTGIKLLHYRYLGEEYCLTRHQRNASRLTQANRNAGYGVHNLDDAHCQHSMMWFKDKVGKAYKVI